MNDNDLAGDGPLPTSLQPRLRRTDEPVIDPVIGTLPCRTMTCTAKVPITKTAFEVMGVFNSLLRSRGEGPILPDRVMYCPACEVENARSYAAGNAARSTRQAELVRELKAEKLPSEDREKEICTQLRALGHDGVDDLAALLKKRRRAKEVRKADRDAQR